MAEAVNMPCSISSKISKRFKLSELCKDENINHETYYSNKKNLKRLKAKKLIGKCLDQKING